METRTYPVEKYRKCPIYFRSMRDHFEYLTIIKNQLYTAHITVKPYWITKLFFDLDISKRVDKVPYSQSQLKNILATLRKMAETTIDFVLDNKDNKLTKK